MINEEFIYDSNIPKEFSYYSNIAMQMFDFANGKINPTNICDLNFSLYPIAESTFGQFRYPNKIELYIENIIDSWDPESNICKRDYICSQLSLTICHELFHSEQSINYKKYITDPDYAITIEEPVAIKTIEWILNNKMDEAFQFNLYIVDKVYDKKFEYIHLEEIKDFYFQDLINGVLMQDMDSEESEELSHYLFSDNVDNVIVGFIDISNGFDENNYTMESVMIKKDGEFLKSTFKDFCNLIYENATKFDGYELSDWYQYYKETKTSSIKFLIKEINLNKL